MTDQKIYTFWKKFRPENNDLSIKTGQFRDRKVKEPESLGTGKSFTGPVIYFSDRFLIICLSVFISLPW